MFDFIQYNIPVSIFAKNLNYTYLYLYTYTSTAHTSSRITSENAGSSSM